MRGHGILRVARTSPSPMLPLLGLWTERLVRSISTTRSVKIAT